MKDRYSHRFVRRAAALVCASLPVIAVGATKNFVGQNVSSYYWSIGSNWSPSGVPGSSDYAYIQPSSYHAFYLLDYNYTPSTGPISITLTDSAYSQASNVSIDTEVLNVGYGATTATYYQAGGSNVGVTGLPGINVQVSTNSTYYLNGGNLGDSNSSMYILPGASFYQAAGTTATFAPMIPTAYYLQIDGTYTMNGGSLNTDVLVGYTTNAATFNYNGGSISGSLNVVGTLNANAPTLTCPLNLFGPAALNLNVPFTVTGGVTNYETTILKAGQTLTATGSGLSCLRNLNDGNSGNLSLYGTLITTNENVNDGSLITNVGGVNRISGGLSLSGGEYVNADLNLGIFGFSVPTLSIAGNVTIANSYSGNGYFANTTSTGYVGIGGSMAVNSGTLAVSGGWVNAAATISAGSSGTITQTGGTLTTSGSLYVGSNVQNGYAIAGLCALSAGLLSVPGAEYVGYNAGGSVSQTGGFNTVGSGLFISYTSGATGSYVLTAPGTVSTPSLYVGFGAGSVGSFSQAGSTVTATGYAGIGYGAGSVGTYGMTGGTLVTAMLEIGHGGTGTFTGSGGTVTVSGSVTLAATPSAPATLSLTNSSLTAATELLASGGSASVTQTGGTNAVSGFLGLASAVGSSASYTFSGGSLTAGSEDVATSGLAVFNQLSGTHAVTGALTLARNVGSSATYVLTSGRLSAGSINLASGGNVSFTQASGTTAATGTFNIGTDTFGTAAVTINGGLLSAASITIYRLGSLSVLGTLSTPTITSDGSLTIANANSVASLTLQSLSTTSLASTLTVTGAMVDNGGALAGGGSLVLPTGSTFNGFGVLNIGSVSNAGTLTASSGNLLIPSSAAFTNTGTLANGVGSNLFVQSATLANSGSLTVNGAGSIVFNSGATNLSGKTVTLLGGTLSTPLLTNQGTVSGFGQLTGDLTNVAGGVVSFYGPTQIVGNLVNRGTFDVSNVQTLVTGVGVNYGTINATKATIIFQSGLTNYGTYNSDPSTNSFTSLAVPASGYVTGSTGDEFIVSGNFTSASTSAAWSTANASLEFDGAGSQTLDYSGHTGTAFAWGPVTVDPSSVLTVVGGARHPMVSGTLSIMGRAVVQSGLTVTGALNLSASATLDLTTNDLIEHNANIAALRAEIANWYDGGLMNGTGLASSSAGGSGNNALATLAVILNSNGEGGALYSTFDGQPALATDALVKYTYIGDTNLDGVVDAQDLANALAGIAGHLTGWQNGDFNYDGVANSTDLSLLLYSLQHQGASFGDSTGGGGAVPEPGGSAGVLPVGTAMLRRRRR